MPAGIWAANNTGTVFFDSSSHTSRQLGQRTATAGYLERITVPISPGKTLWWKVMVTGNLNAYAYRATYVDSSQNQGPNQFTIQVDQPSWNSAQTGTAYFTWGEHVVDVNGGGNNTDPNQTPNPFSLPNLSFTSVDAAVSGHTRTFQITGINLPVTIRVTRSQNSQSGNLGTNRTIIRSSDAPNGPWTTTHATLIGNDEAELTVVNGRYIQFAFEFATTSGTASTSYLLTYHNVSKNAGLGSMSVNATVDSDNNHNVSNPVLGAIDWENIGSSTTANDVSTANSYKTLSGINQAINLRATISNVSGTFSGGSRLEMFVGGNLRYHSTNVANGSWAGGTFNPNEQVAFVAKCVSGDGQQRNVSYTVTVQNLTTGQTVDTFTVNQTVGIPDYTLDGFTLPNIAVVTNEPTGWTNNAIFTVSGISRPVVLRFTRGNQSDSGGIFTRRLYIYRTSNGGASWDEYFIGAGTQGVADITVNNGDVFHIRAYFDTTAGRGDSSFTAYVANQTTGGNQLAAFTVSGTVDADNNYNTAPVNDWTPDVISNWPNISEAANENSKEWSTSWYGEHYVTGINQPITLRFEIYNFNDYGGNIDQCYFNVFTMPPGGSTWDHRGVFDGKFAGGDGLRKFDLENVVNGTRIAVNPVVVTNSMKKTVSFNLVVWSLSSNTQFASSNMTLTVDNDNNHNPPGAGPSGSLANTNLYGYGTVARPGRPATATASSAMTISGGSGPYSVAAEFQNISGTQPIAVVTTSNLTVRISSSTYTSTYGQVRVRITDANGAVGYTQWANVDLTVESLEIGPDI